jgi:hypothetical protein
MARQSHSRAALSAAAISARPTPTPRKSSSTTRLSIRSQRPVRSKYGIACRDTDPTTCPAASATRIRLIGPGRQYAMRRRTVFAVTG